MFCKRCVFSVILFGAFLWVGVPYGFAAEDETQTISYRGIRPDDPLARTGLRNPERGWRIETLIAEPPDADIWGPAAHLKATLPPSYSELWWILDAERYEPFGLTLAQTYCYLDRFMDRPISDEKLDLLRASLDAARRREPRFLLKFTSSIAGSRHCIIPGRCFSH